MTEIREDTPDRGVRLNNKETLGQNGRNINTAIHTGDRGDNPLMELKSIVLSLDWEISDEVMGEFFQAIQRLEDTYSNEKILVSFLHLLDSLGKYIKIHKGKAHPHAGKLLNSTYMSLEKVIRSQRLTSLEKKRMLAGEVKNYRRLREQIAFRKAAAVREETVEDLGKTRPLIEQQGVAPSIEEESRAPDKNHERLQDAVDRIEVLAGALDQLKQFMHDEFKSLREELKEWRKT